MLLSGSVFSLCNEMAFFVNHSFIVLNFQKHGVFWLLFLFLTCSGVAQRSVHVLVNLDLLHGQTCSAFLHLMLVQPVTWQWLGAGLCISLSQVCCTHCTDLYQQPLFGTVTEKNRSLECMALCGSHFLPRFCCHVFSYTS